MAQIKFDKRALGLLDVDLQVQVSVIETLPLARGDKDILIALLFKAQARRDMQRDGEPG